MAILMAMSSYSVAEARNNLPKLLDRMLAGEEVVITRRGKPIARLTPEAEKPVGFKIDLEWLEKNRVKTLKPTDAVETIRELREAIAIDRLSGQKHPYRGLDHRQAD